jgi:hypothetical protein
MALLPDAAKLGPEALARRWFMYIVMGVVAIVATSTVLVHSSDSPRRITAHRSQVGEIHPVHR